MKKLMLTALAAISLASGVNAQGYFNIDSTFNGGNGATATSTSGGLVFINGVLDTDTDINMQILWGTTSSSVTSVLNMDPGSVNNPANTAWFAAQGTGTGDITFPANGSITDPNGNSYTTGSAVGTTVFLQVYAWLGNATSYANAVSAQAAVAQSSIFSVSLVASSDVVHMQDMRSMSSLNLVAASPVPEPSTLALAGLGGFGMLMAMRRKKA